MEMADRRADLLTAMASLKAHSQLMKEPFKARAYARVIEQLLALPAPITRFEDVAGLPGVGPSIRQALRDAFDGVPVVVDPRLQALTELQTVTGIGPARAAALVDAGVTGVADLRARAAAGDPLKLNARERLGLEHHASFLDKIPRSEMDAHRRRLEATMRDVAPDATLTLMGSYRRGLASSGDIDAAVVGADAAKASAAMSSLVDRLVADGYALKAHFGRGAKKFLGVVRLTPASPFRRLDLMAVPAAEAPFALLYFTGSDRFNVRVRGLAKAAGFSLNEHGLVPESPEARARLLDAGPQALATEADVLRFLGVAPVPPEERLA